MLAGGDGLPSPSYNHHCTRELKLTHRSSLRCSSSQPQQLPPHHRQKLLQIHAVIMQALEDRISQITQGSPHGKASVFQSSWSFTYSLCGSPHLCGKLPNTTRKSAFATDSCGRCVVVVDGTCTTRSAKFIGSTITVVDVL
jgi:hypothetical protein